MIARKPPAGRRLVHFGFGLVAGILVSGIVAALIVSPLLLTRAGASLSEGVYGNVMLDIASVRGGQALPLVGTPPQRLKAQNQDQQDNAGRNAFTGSCAGCHGVNGDGKGTTGKLTGPNATDLTVAATKAKSDDQLAWIIKNGVAFSAMPGFANDYRDEDVKAIVGYLRTLQNRQAKPVTVPSVPPAQFAAGNPRGTPEQRGAALYFSMGCVGCHGPIGDDSGPMAYQDVSSAADQIRKGQPGMPAFGNKLTDAQINDLVAFLNNPPQ